MMTPHDDAVRTIVELPEAQIKALARLCRQEGISRAEAIRRAVDKLVAANEAATSQAHFQAAFGLWRHKKRDGIAYVDALRAEWDDQPASY